MSEASVATPSTSEAVLRSDPGHDYWNALVDEGVAAEFLDLTPRSMQAMRQRGGGPRFMRLSARCIRYRRIDLSAWADALLRDSTSDPGGAAA